MKKILCFIFGHKLVTELNFKCWDKCSRCGHIRMWYERGQK